MDTVRFLHNLCKFSFIATLATLLLAQDAQADYTPPIGIPAPSFGIDNVAPATPADWNLNLDGFYYVRSGGDNSGNGFPADPRSTIPDPIPAGSVVIIEGAYTTKHETNRLTANGTASQPVYIRGMDQNNRAVLNQKIVIEGSYYVIEYVDGVWSNSSYNGKLHLTGDHGVVRYGDFRGDTNGCVGGVHIDSGSSHHVLYQNNIHHSGDVNAGYDQDCHGTRVSPNVSSIWILENEYSYNSGDGIQINAGSAGNDSIHHIYVGRNESHHNKQVGMWTKQARDVIFSENHIYGHVSSDSSGGSGTGFQYGPDYVWFIFNRIHDNESGIMLASDSGGTGTEHFIIGNEIYNIHKNGAYDVNNSWENAAIGVWGSTNTHIIGNTIWNVDAGINSPRARGKIDIINNIIDAPSVNGANHIYFYMDLIETSRVDHNLFINPVTLRLGSSRQIDLAGLQGIHDKGHRSHAVDSLAFISSARGDFIPSPTSAAAQNGDNTVDAYQIFYNRYGIDINKDITGAPRILDGAAEIGAYEISGTTTPTLARPSPPVLLLE
ncbi:MAG: hypothetical protein ABW152_10620 [Candidatus Thiodiazotropha endolucinida]